MGDCCSKPNNPVQERRYPIQEEDPTAARDVGNTPLSSNQFGNSLAQPNPPCNEEPKETPVPNVCYHLRFTK